MLSFDAQRKCNTISIMLSNWRSLLICFHLRQFGEKISTKDIESLIFSIYLSLTEHKIINCRI